jgi:CheY-like chemotaxis protein
MEASERGASITRRLLAFGRRGDLRAEAFDVGSLLAGLREILAHTLGAPIGVTVRLGADLPPLLADKGQLETALVNLATNARDAMPEGGRLTLAAETEIVAAGAAPHGAGLAPGRYVRLTVADTGGGMDAATLARAAEPFFTTKDLGVGTGLGLPMAKGFAEQSGGALAIESSPGKGCTVTVWLPAAGSADAGHGGAAGSLAVAEPGSGAPGEAKTHARVLLVDDEALVREVLAEHLEEAGFGVVAAASGTEALALLAAGEAVDALVTDLSMPGMDGLAVIRAAQERRPGLPAVLLTGYAGDGAALAVGGAVSGTFSLLRKPVSGVLLVDRVRALLAEGGRRKTEV